MTTNSGEQKSRLIDLLALVGYVSSALLFGAFIITAAGIVVIGSIIWLQTATWPEWYLAMWVPMPITPQLAGVQEIIYWIWLQPLLNVTITVGFCAPVALILITLGIMRIAEAN